VAFAAPPLPASRTSRRTNVLKCRWQRLRWRPTSHTEGVFKERQLLDLLQRNYEQSDVKVRWRHAASGVCWHSLCFNSQLQSPHW
jgi:hypothetical protein